MASKLCVARPAPQREGAVVTVAPHSGGSESRRSSRAAERRKGMNALTGVVAESLSGARTPRYLRERFEDELCALLNARRVDLRDGVAAARPAPGSPLVTRHGRARSRSAPSTSRLRRRGGAGRVGSADAWVRAAPGDARVDHRSRRTRRPVSAACAANRMVRRRSLVPVQASARCAIVSSGSRRRTSPR